MAQRLSESENLLQRQQANKKELEEEIIQKEKLKWELEMEFTEKNKDKNNIISQIKEKENELSQKKSKIYRVIKFLKTLIEKGKIQEEINKLKRTKKDLEDNTLQILESIEKKKKEISSLKDSVKSRQKEIVFILSQRENGMDLFESRWVKREDLPKLKEARIGISNNFSNLSPYEFEHFVAKLLREMGYSTNVTQKTGDYGVDIIAKKDNDVIAVQCKRFQEGNLVGNRDIQRVLGAMYSINAQKCIFVTTSRYTRQAIQQSKGCPIELWDKEILHNFVKKYLLDLDIKEIFSLMERERKKRLKIERERIRLLEEKREKARERREERIRRLDEIRERGREEKEEKRILREERRKIEKKKRICPRCGRNKMKNRKYCSLCKREIRIENRYNYY